MGLPILIVKRDTNIVYPSNMPLWQDKVAGATSVKVLRYAIGFAKHIFALTPGPRSNQCEFSYLNLSPLAGTAGTDQALALLKDMGELWWGGVRHETWDPSAESLLVVNGMGTAINSLWAVSGVIQEYWDVVPPFDPAQVTTSASLALYRFFTRLNEDRLTLPGGSSFVSAGGPPELLLMRFTYNPATE